MINSLKSGVKRKKLAFKWFNRTYFCFKLEIFDLHFNILLFSKSDTVSFNWMTRSNFDFLHTSPTLITPCILFPEPRFVKTIAQKSKCCKNQYTDQNALH